MDRIHQLFYAIGIVVMAVVVTCGESSQEQTTPRDNNLPTSNEESDHWRLIITRADGRTEIVPSADAPQICGTRENPRVLLLCGRGLGTPGDVPAPFWDYLPVNIEAGDAYRIEPPSWLTPPPTPTSPTPTVMGP